MNLFFTASAAAESVRQQLIHFTCTSTRRYKKRQALSHTFNISDQIQGNIPKVPDNTKRLQNIRSFTRNTYTSILKSDNLLTFGSCVGNSLQRFCLVESLRTVFQNLTMRKMNNHFLIYLVYICNLLIALRYLYIVNLES